MRQALAALAERLTKRHHHAPPVRLSPDLIRHGDCSAGSARWISWLAAAHASPKILAWRRILAAELALLETEAPHVTD